MKHSKSHRDRNQDRESAEKAPRVAAVLRAGYTNILVCDGSSPGRCSLPSRKTFRRKEVRREVG